jgi:hypothetical protein
MLKVEQVTRDARVVLAPDVVLSKKEIQAVLSTTFETVTGSNPYSVVHEGVGYTVCVKNITYLGHPHPKHKKRIQISKKWRATLMRPDALLLGVYSYDKQLLFVLFSPETYRKKKANNSSAHVHTIDLLSAVRYGTFEKIDRNGNKLVICTAQHIREVIKKYAANSPLNLVPELKLVDDMIRTVPTVWVGTDVYDEMLARNSPNALQGEWPGFYFEFLFSAFLDRNRALQSICRFVSDKSADGLDFDLNFRDNFLGDLKTHLLGTDVLGNDQASMKRALRRYGRLWYVILSYTREKDSDNAYVTTEHWNMLLRTRRDSTKSLRSYGSKMKHSVHLKELVVAEIHTGNAAGLRPFVQGRNSNGALRAPKFLIAKKDIDNYVIFRKLL